MKSLSEIKVLHICNAYSKSLLYKNLVQALNKHIIKQHIYVPVRSTNELNKNMIDSSDIKYTFSYILVPIYRLFYFFKIRKIFKDIEKNISIESINCVHSHFLFSNGGVAYKIKKKYGIKYITAIRNTDINLFYKYMIHLRGFAYKILKEAEMIVFISPSYIDYLQKILSVKQYIAIKNKFVVIPNGIDNFYLNQKVVDKKLDNNKLRLLYIGAFTKSKNVETTIQVAKELNNRNHNVSLTIVGGGGKDEKKILQLIKENSELITYHGRISEKEKISKIFHESDIFVMPSKTETFGLVYAEALSHGLPIIYTKGQGFDNQFPDGQNGFCVDAINVNEICEKIEIIVKDYSNFSKKAFVSSKVFNWDDIAIKYEEIYQKCS